MIFIKLFVTLRKEFKRNHPIQMVFKRGIGHFRNTQHIHTVQPAHQCDKPPGDIRGVSSKRKFSCLFALLDNCDRFLMPHLHREEISISDVRIPIGQNLRLSPQFYVRLKAAVFATQHSVKPCTPGGGRQQVETVGIPIHWGFEGVARKGYIANTLTPNVGDANSQTPEYKAFLVNIEKA